jgi:hypothetical protein
LYNNLLEAVKLGACKFPAYFRIKVSISEYSLEGDELMFRGRK